MEYPRRHNSASRIGIANNVGLKLLIYGAAVAR